MAASCAQGKGGVPDDQLGGLVVEPRPVDLRVDVDKAAMDPQALQHALTLPFAATLAKLGPLTVVVETRTVVTEGDKPVSDLTDQAKLEIGELAGGAFHGVYTNSADYGRETLFAGGTLYLRPRYQVWNARAPETKDEPQALRDAYVAAVAATWDLLAPAVELSDRGALEVAGRAGRRIEVKQAPSPKANPPEPLDHRKWREGRTIEGVTGEVVLDADTGLPLAVKLAGTVGFARDARQFQMKLALDAKVTKVGAVAIAAPASEEVIATPERMKEVDERDMLLKGIAPPIKKRPDDLPDPATAAATEKKPEKPEKKKVGEKKPEPKSEAKSEAKTEPKSEKKAGCTSATLGREVEEGYCIQSGSNAKHYRCTEGKWVTVEACP
ncbi:MAG: hypothetical protein KIT31_07850 [Deltaproteobacteria bacterium]|nr:hypothetical protein [Deltaproteobacteria bacterium]